MEGVLDGEVDGKKGREEVKKILVVDDDVMIRRSLGDLFSSRYVVILAADGDEGLTKVGEENPDLVISDFHMLRMDGDKLLDALRLGGHTMPVVICAAGVGENTVAQLLRKGATAFVNKGGREAVKTLVETVRELFLWSTKTLKTLVYLGVAGYPFYTLVLGVRSEPDSGFLRSFPHLPPDR